MTNIKKFPFQVKLEKDGEERNILVRARGKHLVERRALTIMGEGWVVRKITALS